MILEKESAGSLNGFEWPSLPDITTGVVKKDFDEETGLGLIFMKDPQSHGDAMVAITHSVAALRDSHIIFTASLEALDLRALSAALGKSVKNLKNEYGVKGFLAESRIVLYGNGEKEDLGVYLGSERDEDVFSFLRGLFEDSFVSSDDSWIIE